MGAGKSTLAPVVAERLGRGSVDLDDELGADVSELFARAEEEFRAIEERRTCELLAASEPAVLALGGGAVESPAVRRALGERAFTVWLDVDAGTAWERAQGTNRPLARTEDDFRARHERRRPLYADVADAVAGDADGVVLAAAGVHVESGAVARLGELVPGEGPVALVTDARVAGIHGADAQLALGDRLASVHEVAKTLTSCATLWRELRLERGGTIAALGGGTVSDTAGFVAATYLRGIAWAPVPTTLVGQTDAAIGGKTGVDLAEGKNLVGAFHWPAKTIVDPELLATLPAEERRAGLAEVVKTGLLAGEPLWELPEPEQVRRCAAFKSAVCLRDPLERGERAILNLGHTFAHALEAAGVPSHGHAVALGLLAALRLSGLETTAVQETLAPEPARVDPERAWQALLRDKKAAGGRVRLVLLDAPGEPRWPAELAEAEVRRALDGIIAS
ncbi:MAG: iron-containing alcohol dehydrogenase [Thermoleophilia bacterium]|nr:iron-containing alcohol dehydrogenase [Thermoleophilia bacterium]